MKHIYYTDGACSGAPGPGGWGWVYRNTDQTASGNEENTTNNRMEIMGALMAIRHAITISGKGDEIIIHSDSSYVVNTINRWLQKWYRKREIHNKKNMDLWKEIWGYKLRYNITAVWVRGHFGDRYNEMADTLATTAKQKIL